MTPDEILTRLRHERHHAGLSLQRLADKHDMHVATVRAHEAGERAMTVAQLVEHASWFGLEVVLLPVGEGVGGELYQRGYDYAVTQVAELFGLPIDAEAMRRHNEPRAAPVDWDAALAEARDEIEQEATDA